MKTVLLLGVGRSTHTLIKYLINSRKELNTEIVLADQCSNAFVNSYVNQNKCRFLSIDINNNESRRREVSKSDLVISMLPPKFHILVAKDCVEF